MPLTLSSSAGQVSEDVSKPIRSLSSPSNQSVYFIFSVLTSTLSTFNFGYHSAVINQPRSAIAGCSLISKNCIPMNDWFWGVFVSLFVVGGIAGSAGVSLLTWDVMELCFGTTSDSF